MFFESHRTALGVFICVRLFSKHSETKQKTKTEKKKITYENFTINWTHASSDLFAAKLIEGSHL